MTLLALSLLALVHLYFLFKVWIHVGFLWSLLCFVIPVVGLYLVLREWPLFREVFLAEIGLVVVIFVSRVHPLP